MSEDKKIIHEFDKNSVEIVRTSISDFKGQMYADFRVWRKPDDGGDLQPTKKGLCISVECLDDLLKAVQMALSRTEFGSIPVDGSDMGG